jgi:hypothetical protein
MPTGLLTRSETGKLDTWLIGNPEVTFFKSIFKRHTNFSVGLYEHTFPQYPVYGEQTTIQITRHGDLISDIYAHVTLPALNTEPYYIYGAGNALFKRVELSIGGQVISTQYSDWLNIWNELILDEGHIAGHDSMVRNYYNKEQTGEYTCYVRFRFWFTDNPALAIPIIALAYHEIRLLIEFERLENLVSNHDGITSRAGNLQCKIFVEYIFLDTDERRIFAQSSHEYLITQVQYNEFDIPASAPFYNAHLQYNLPVKELIWIHTRTEATSYGPFDYSYANSSKRDLHTFTTAKLMINGDQRASVRNADYYYLVQNYQRHSRIPRSDMIHTTYDDTYAVSYGNYRNLIYTYSFALNPEEWQPSGSCNYSKVKSCELQLTYGITAYAPYDMARKLKVFAVNYNILRTMSGMCALAYSN